MAQSIETLDQMNDAVNAVCNRILDIVAKESTSGQQFVSFDDLSDLITRDDYLQYGHLIARELSAREEVMEEVVFENGEFDVNIGLVYCQAYEWMPGDEETFGCTEEEWEQQEAKPVQPLLSKTRMAEIGQAAVAYIMESSKDFVTDLTECVGLSMEEVACLTGTAHEEEAVPDLTVYEPNKDLYIGCWRVHVADTGEKYGTYMDFVNDKKPIVEFFDMRHVDPVYAPNGQFTGGQYYVETILGRGVFLSGDTSYPRGLSLAGDVPAWTVSAEEMETVVAYLRSFETFKAHRKSPLSHQIGSAEYKRDLTTPKPSAQKAPGSPKR